MFISNALSYFSIRKQILFGFVPVLVLVGFLAFASYQHFEAFSKDLETLSAITGDKQIFLEIEKDVVELQRNVLVYSYVGFKGVLKKIEFLQKELEQKFRIIRPLAQLDKDINERFKRIFDHYNNYKIAFAEAVKKRGVLEELSTDKLEPLIQKHRTLLQKNISDFEKEQNFEAAYMAIQIERNILQANINIKSFEKIPDTRLNEDTIKLIKKIREDAQTLRNYPIKNINKKNISEFLILLDQYERIFIDIITLNRVYLHLINVVLAGKALEIDTLSHELKTLFTERAQTLSSAIEQNIRSAQRNHIYLLFFTALISIVSALFIAMNIAKPVSAMASTLSKLARGNGDTNIPGLQRRDEIGQMSKAANEFKNMGIRLEKQGTALTHANEELEEFAYRTSHDLRSPLVSSIGLLSIAQDAIHVGESEQAITSLKHAQNSLKQMEVLVKDILSLTQTKNVEEDIQIVDIAFLVDETLKKFNNMENFKRLDIQKLINSKGKLETQQSRFTLVLENLISNAIKYQDIEKENSYIKISTYDSHGSFVLEVQDNGLGIPKNQQKKLFTMFKRFHPRISFGSGLGLYMVQKSTEIMGARIEFDDPEDGSIFRLVMPTKKI